MIIDYFIPININYSFYYMPIASHFNLNADKVLNIIFFQKRGIKGRKTRGEKRAKGAVTALEECDD